MHANLYRKICELTNNTKIRFAHSKRWDENSATTKTVEAHRLATETTNCHLNHMNLLVCGERLYAVANVYVHFWIARNAHESMYVRAYTRFSGPQTQKLFSNAIWWQIQIGEHQEHFSHRIINSMLHALSLQFLLNRPTCKLCGRIACDSCEQTIQLQQWSTLMLFLLLFNYEMMSHITSAFDFSLYFSRSLLFQMRNSLLN